MKMCIELDQETLKLLQQSVLYGKFFKPEELVYKAVWYLIYDQLGIDIDEEKQKDTGNKEEKEADDICRFFCPDDE